MQVLKLGMAAAAVGVLALAAAPALAQQGQPGQPAAIQLSKQVAGPMNEARNAILAKDFATAKAKLDAASAVAQTPQDKFQIEKLRFNVADGLKDFPGRVKAIENIIASNMLTPAELKTYKAVLPQAYAEAGDLAKSRAAGKAFLDEFGGTADQYAAFASDTAKSGDNAGALPYIEKAIATSKAAGTKPPESYYKLVLRIHSAMQQMDKYYAVEEQLLADYPNEIYWKELIARAQKAPSYGAVARLDLYRALIGAGVKLSPQEKGIAASEAVKRGMPNEAVQILEPAFASGELGSDPKDKDTLEKAQGMVKDDKANIAKEEKDTLAKGTGEAMAKLGEAYMTYGDNAKATDLIQKGLAKGIADPGEADIAKLHLGIAQLRAGQKDAAKATFAGIKSDNGAAILAHNWSLIADLRP